MHAISPSFPLFFSFSFPPLGTAFEDTAFVRAHHTLSFGRRFQIQQERASRFLNHAAAMVLAHAAADTHKLDYAIDVPEFEQCRCHAGACVWSPQDLIGACAVFADGTTLL